MAAVEHLHRVEIGEILAQRYEVLELLSSSAHAAVCRGRDRATGRDVAIKLAVSSQSRRDLAGEARAYAALSHPHIPVLLDSGTSGDGRPFLVFEYVAGVTLRALLDGGRSLDARTTLRWMAQVLDALEAAHRAGIVHRDIKPDNVMIVASGVLEHAVLLDFGFRALADEQTPAELLGTPRYAAPEQLRGEAPGPASDLYSWGLVVLECLSGASAVVAESAHEAVRAQLDESPIAMPRDLARTPLGRFLAAVVSKQPSRRPASAREAMARLSRIVPLELADDIGDRDADEPAHCDERLVGMLEARIAAEVADAARREAFEEASRLVRSFGGTIVSALGERLIAVFGVVEPSGADVLDAIDAADALVCQSRSARWGAGVHAASMRVSQPRTASPLMILGDPALVAGALAEAARPGRVLVSGSVRARAQDQWATAPVSSAQAGVEAGDVFVLRRRRTLAPVAEVRSAFTGRTCELARIAEAWSSAQRGCASAVFLVGGAGIGKSRLVREARGIASGADWLEARCSLERQTVPLSPVVDLIRSLGCGAEALAKRYELPDAHAVPVLATLLSEPMPPGTALPAVTPERLRELTATTCCRLLLQMAGDGPAILFFDDLQWADSSTIDFLRLLLDEIAAGNAEGHRLALLVIMTSRPELAGLWQRPDVAEIVLDPMQPHEVERMIRAEIGEAAAIAPALVAQLAAASRGVPLFIEQAVRLLAGRSRCNDVVPGDIDSVLSAQIASLGDGARRLVQVAAVMGQEFDLRLVGVVARLRPAAVPAALREAAEAGIVAQHQQAEPGRYRFTHALIRDAAYDSMTQEQAAAAHAGIAKALEREHPEVGIRRPAELAIHFELGGEPATAVDLWHRSGVSALSRAAYPEALQDLERGMALLDRVAAGDDHMLRSIGLATALSSAHITTRGFAAPETRSAVLRARQLCDRLGRDVPLEVLGAIFGSALVTADGAETAAIMPVFRVLSRRTDSPLHAFAGHQVLAVHDCWSGRFDDAWAHAWAGMELYRRESVAGVAWEFGFGIHCHAYGMMVQSHRGFPEQADVIRAEMMERAESNGNPHCVAVALGWSTTFTHDCGRDEETLELAMRLLRLSREQHLYLWSGYAQLARGAAIANLGQPRDGVEIIREGLQVLEAVGVRCGRMYYLAWLGQAMIAGGDLEGARAVVREGMELSRTYWTRLHEAELVRLHGVILEKTGTPSEAAGEYRRAAQIARKDGSRSMELRALSDLFAATGDSAARRELAAAYDSLVEGHETTGMRRAKQLLSRP
ncbi:MAG TPA: AAA family ATPase [Candidatus Binatia bacterium]|nr:AAA family ATPase [Candidatus Binatia bacterium]